MRPGETFEIDCCNYLNRVYGNTNIVFQHEGSMDSTKSDIEVLKNGKSRYYIEAKDTVAQSGQFVLFSDEASRTFLFSPKNRSEPNEMTEIIIEYMNRNFNRYCNAGTAGEDLDIDSTVFSNWIRKHYEEKNVKYIISYRKDYVILPIRKFAEYFHVSATYRVKKSGSSEPAQKDLPGIMQAIRRTYPEINFVTSGKKLFATSPYAIRIDNFILGKYTYYFAEQSKNLYEIRRLSNTRNMNVIFSIRLKKAQDDSDLAEFEADL